MKRVVTGHDSAGRSVILADGDPPPAVKRSESTPRVINLWATAETPADNAGSAEAIDREFPIPPPPNGSIFRIVEYPPDRVRLAGMAARTAGGGPASEHDASLYHGGSRHPGFHKTHTIDYAIVLSGEIWALMDEGETLLRAGDVLIQRGTNHAWSNRTDVPVRVAFVLIDARPVGQPPGASPPPAVGH